MRTRADRVELWGGTLLAALGITAACESTVGTGPRPCDNAEPIVVGGVEVGIERCDGGTWKHRKTAVSCPNLLPRADYSCHGLSGQGGAGGAGGAGGGGAGGGLPNGECDTDADCGGGTSYCGGGDFEGGCSCRSGCETDADCGAGQICECGELVGQCVTASCKTDGDCVDGFLCSTYITEPGCGGLAYACQTDADQCASDADCGSNEQCTLRQGSRICEQISCAIGRPFLVDGKPRLAATESRHDWCVSDLEPRLEGIDGVSRALLAGYFTDIGRMEHASIAAFARFSLELLALGAPPDLITRAQSAMADETRHTRYAFALASAYRGRALGPGPLAIDGVLGECDLVDVLRRAVKEGCVGETVASMEAREAHRKVSDPALHFVFGEVARDEAEHALLAWRSVQWLLEQGGEPARRALCEEIALLGQEVSQGAPPAASEVDETLLALGYVSDTVRAELRYQALSRAIIGGLVSMLEGPPSSVASRVTLVD